MQPTELYWSTMLMQRLIGDMYWRTVQPCGTYMYYETMLLFEVNPATNQTPNTCKIYVLFATPFKMGRFEILVPPAKSEMEIENLSVSARQG